MILRTAALALSALLAACSSYPYVAKADRVVDVAHVPDTPLRVTATNGSIEVLGALVGDQVHVVASVTARGATQDEADERLAATRVLCERDETNCLVIRAEFPDQRRSSEGVSYIVSLPGAAGATLRTANGRIVAKNLGGTLEVDTSNGAVAVHDHRGPVDLRTSNGRIEVRGLAGPARARTSNGPVSVELDADQAGPVDLRTSNGTIDVAVGAAFCGELNMRTSNGRVRVENASSAQLQQELDRSAGSVRFAAAGPVSELRTSNGSITVRVRD